MIPKEAGLRLGWAPDQILELRSGACSRAPSRGPLVLEVVQRGALVGVGMERVGAQPHLPFTVGRQGRGTVGVKHNHIWLSFHARW